MTDINKLIRKINFSISETEDDDITLTLNFSVEELKVISALLEQEQKRLSVKQAKAEYYAALQNSVKDSRTPDPDPIPDFQPGDKVVLYPWAEQSYPTYLARQPLKLLRKNKAGNYVCDYDGGKPFSIPGKCLKYFEERKK